MSVAVEINFVKGWIKFRFLQITRNRISGAAFAPWNKEFPITCNSKQYLSNNTEAALLAAAEHCRMPDASLLFSLIGIHRRPAIHIGIMSFMVGDFAFEIAVINRSC